MTLLFVISPYSLLARGLYEEVGKAGLVTEGEKGKVSVQHVLEKSFGVKERRHIPGREKATQEA